MKSVGGVNIEIIVNKINLLFVEFLFWIIGGRSVL